MMYLLSFALLSTVFARTESERRLVDSQATDLHEDLAMEQDFLDTLAVQMANAMFIGVEEYFLGDQPIDGRRLEEGEYVTQVEQRRLICGGLCIAAATAGVGSLATSLFSWSVEAPDMENNAHVSLPLVDAMATTAAEGAFEAVETQFGIAGVQKLGDELAKATGVRRRFICGGLCIAAATAAVSGATTGLFDSMWGASVETGAMNVDVSMSPSQEAEVARVEAEAIEELQRVGLEGAMNAMSHFDVTNF